MRTGQFISISCFENRAIKASSDCRKENEILPMDTFNILLLGDNPQRHEYKA